MSRIPIRVAEVPAVLCALMGITFWVGVWTLAGWVWHLFAYLAKFLALEFA